MKYFLTILLFIITQKSYAQLDNVHYLQPMINYNYGTDGMMKAENVYISTPSETEITVNVTKMDGAEFPIYVHYYTETGGHISSGWANDGKVKISKYKFARTSLGASPGNTPTLRPLSESFQNISASLGGLTFKSNKEFYVNYRAHANGHAVSFLSKGRRAVGKNFHWGGAPARHRASTTNINNFVTVTALEDGGTDVTFSGLKLGMNVMNGTSNYNINGTTYTRNLNKGESIVVRVKLEGNNGSAAVNTLHRNGWMGTKITSNKNIVVTNGGLAMQGGAEGNADYGIEQITPIEYLGTEHMVMQGLGATADEKVYVIATEPSTIVTVNGTTYQTLNNIGDWVEIPGTQFTNMHMKVNTTKPAYVFLKNFGNTADNTCNLVQVPPVGCNGKTDIMIADASRVVEANFSTTTLLLMARNSGTSKPKIYINESLRASASADKTASSSDGKWTIYKMKIGNSTNNVKNVRVVYDGSVQVQLLGASGDAGYGGYYNGFAQSSLFDIIVENPRFNQVCTSDTGNTLLKPELLNYVGTYKWYKNNVLIEGINTQTYQLTENDTDPAIYRMEVLMPDGCSYYTENIQSVKCPCSKEPNNNVGVLYPGIVGVSTTDNADKIWPNNVNNAFLTLKSNDKGLVITRNPDPESTITSPVEGMIVYDTDDNCYKLFDGTTWKCLRKKCYDYDN